MNKILNESSRRYLITEMVKAYTKELSEQIITKDTLEKFEDMDLIAFALAFIVTKLPR